MEKKDRKLTTIEIENILMCLLKTNGIDRSILSLFLVDEEERIVRLKWLGECTFKELAIGSGVSETMVSNIYYRALGRLRRSIIYAGEKYKHMDLILQENETLKLQNQTLTTRFNQLTEEDKRRFGSIDKLSIPLEELQLSIRAYNLLHTLNVLVFADILNLTERDLLLHRGYGKKTANEIELFVRGSGYELRQR